MLMMRETFSLWGLNWIRSGSYDGSNSTLGHLLVIIILQMILMASMKLPFNNLNRFLHKRPVRWRDFI